MKNGCFYNPRPAPGRCIKDLNSDVIDSRCEIIDSSCRLLSADKSNKTLEAAAVSRQEVYSLPTKLPSKDIDAKISGPISAFYTKRDKIYNFFGDMHFSFGNNCKPCKDFIDNTNKIDPVGSESCWDISRLLADVFTKASKENNWIDFYIEIPFHSKIGIKPSNMESFDYISKLYNIFYNCLHKIDCEYNTVRFHYVDIRLQYKEATLDVMEEILKEFLGESVVQNNKKKYQTEIINYEMYVTMERIPICIDYLSYENIAKTPEFKNFVEDTDKLIKDLYFTGGQTTTGTIEAKNRRLFMLYLTSDNFPEEAYELLKDSIGDSKKIYNTLVPPTLLVNRRGKSMHRVRSQIEALENEGKGEIAKKLVEYLSTRYKKEVKDDKIRELWTSFMNVYNSFTNGKIKSPDSFRRFIEAANKEIEEVSYLFKFGVTGNALLMDAYTLARMFRTYPQKRHIDSNKVIVYAGAAHIETYVDFFEKVLSQPFVKYEPNGKLDELTKKSVTRCLDVHLDYFL
jgi:hypothetical protein